MKTAAFIANFLALIVICLLMADDSPSFSQPKELAIYALFTITPLVTLIVFFLDLGASQGNGGWLSLYFQRKAAEERKKIQDLSGPS